MDCEINRFFCFYSSYHVFTSYVHTACKYILYNGGNLLELYAFGFLALVIVDQPSLNIYYTKSHKIKKIPKLRQICSFRSVNIFHLARMC